MKRAAAKKAKSAKHAKITKGAKNPENKRKRAPRLPKELRPLFWDCDFDKPRWRKYQGFIIERLLSRGDWPALMWLREEVGDTLIRKTLLTTAGRGLSPRQLRYWELIVGLPHRLVTKWIGAPARAIWHGRAR